MSTLSDIADGDDTSPLDQELDTKVHRNENDIFSLMLEATENVEIADTLSFDDFTVRDSAQHLETVPYSHQSTSRGIDTFGDSYLSDDEGETNRALAPDTFEEDFDADTTTLTATHISSFIASLPEQLRACVPTDQDFEAFLSSKPVPPKKPMSAYFLFVNDARARYKEAHPQASVADVVKALTEEWRVVDDSTKASYEAQVAANKVTYDAAFAHYKDVLALWEQGVEFRRKTLGLAVERVEEGVADVLPLSRVKAIAGMDEELSLVSKDALVLLSKAAEGFVAHLGRTLAAHATRTGKRTVRADAVELAVKTQSALSFLRGCAFIFDGSALGTGAEDDVAMGDDLGGAGEADGTASTRESKRTSTRGSAGVSAADHGAILRVAQKGAAVNPFDFAPAGDVFGGDVFGADKPKKRASKAKAVGADAAKAPAKRKSAAKKASATIMVSLDGDIDAAGETDAAQYLSDEEGAPAAALTPAVTEGKGEKASAGRKKSAAATAATAAAQGKQSLMAMLAKQQALSERQQQDGDFDARLAEMEAFTSAPLAKGKGRAGKEKGDTKPRKSGKKAVSAAAEDDVIVSADGRRIRVDEEGNEVEVLADLSDGDAAPQPRRAAKPSRSKRGAPIVETEEKRGEVLVVSDDDEEEEEEEEEEVRVPAKRARGAAWLSAKSAPVEEEEDVTAAYMSDDDADAPVQRRGKRPARRVVVSESDSEGSDDGESDAQESGDDFAVVVSDEEESLTTKRKRKTRNAFAAFMKK